MIFQLTASRGGWRHRLLIFWDRNTISTHSLTRRLTYVSFHCNPFIYISTHSLTRRLTVDCGLLMDMTVTFQLTASRGGWHRSYGTPFIGQPFQLTASRGGWRNVGILLSIIGYFNSQPHEEADKKALKANFDDYIISTHSLTRRLTLVNMSLKKINLHFNSQPHEEADYLSGNQKTTLNLFQLTASRGGWQSPDAADNCFCTFQLTASRGGWRGICHKALPPHKHFNSQPHEEADRKCCQFLSNLVTFQLTASRGGWQCSVTLLEEISHFNSQPHEEADAEVCSNSVGQYVFQLTASRGGWRDTLGYTSEMVVISTHSLTRRLTTLCGLTIDSRLFQLTASRGGWQDASEYLTLWHGHFNSQPHEEADANPSSSISAPLLFQLTASRGGWQSPDAADNCFCTFQLTASRGGWQCSVTLLEEISHFNSQPHEEADAEVCSNSVGQYVFQLTASRGGWRDTLGYTSEMVVISTHSLTRRLTAVMLYIWKPLSAFQLTASRGGWLFWMILAF